MSKLWSISKKEILSYFVSPLAYFVLTGFLLIGGYFFLNLVGYFNLIMERIMNMPFYGGAETPNLNQWVIEQFYQTLVVVLVFATPLLTMRLLAEEKKKGTFELLITSPLTVSDIVIGKYLGVAAIITLMVLLSWAFPATLIVFGDPEVPPMLSGLLGVLLCALSFASVGMAASSFTDNQTIAGFMTMVVLFFLYFSYAPAESLSGPAGEFLRNLSPAVQTQEMVNGVISLKSVFYFVSLIVVGLFVSHRAVEAQRWR